MQLPWSHLFLLGVVLVRSTSRAQDTSSMSPTVPSQEGRMGSTSHPTTTLSLSTSSANHSQRATPTSAPTSVRTNSSHTQTTDVSTKPASIVTTGTFSSEVTITTSTTSTTAIKTTITGVPPGPSNRFGYVILFFMVLAIIVMLFVICLLRKKSMKYSFDLQRPGYDHETPLTGMEQPGTFEPTKENAGGFECVSEDGAEEEPQTQVANGSAGEPGVPPSAVENEKKDEDGYSFNDLCCTEISLTPPVKRVGFSLDLDLSDMQSDQSEAGDKEHNANNNNVAVAMFPDILGLTFDPMDPDVAFTNISLDV